MEYSDIRDLTVEELRKREAGMRTEYFEMRMKHTLGQVGNPLQLRFIRKDLARIKTALTAKLTR
ncbi:MAG: 50S ribosomal protein L29 [Bdellovibrionales bacterium]|jgi:large subunit ribosomal protein L29